MNISIIRKEHLGDIRELDSLCFNRPEKRSIENIFALWDISNGGAFVGKEDNKFIAYIFTHTYGTIGTIGPLGVLNNYRNKGYAKKIIGIGMEYLKKNGCNIIGLEVLPDKVENIGLYFSLGFRFTQPSILVKIKCNKYTHYKSLVNGNNISIDLVEEFSNKFLLTHSGYSFYNDIIWVLKHAPDKVIFLLEENSIKGFLSYKTDLYGYVWGYISKESCNQYILNNMFAYLGEINSCNVLPIRINMRYYDFFRENISGITVDKVIDRMIFQSGNNKVPKKDEIIFRSWIG